MRLKIFVLNLFFLIGFSLDRLTKLYFHKTDKWMELIPGQLLFNLYHNDGLVFGWGQTNLIINIIIFLIIIVLISWLTKEYKEKNWSQIIALSLILIGAISNLIDRLYLGSVIDWIQIPWWSVFNLADIYIIAGTLWWAKNILYGAKKIPKE